MRRLRCETRAAVLVLLLVITPTVVVTTPIGIGAVDLIERAEASALVEMEAGVQTRDARFQKAELIALPRFDLELAGNMSLTGIGRVRLDAFDRLDPGQPRLPWVANGSRRRYLWDHADWELRELYLRAPLGRAHLTLGKQQVVWGEADGLKVLDIVNPQSFREFILDDFEDSRIPLWTVNLEIPLGPGDLQLLWVPDPSFHELPAEDGVFGFRSPRLLPPRILGTVPLLVGVDPPGNAFRDSDLGARLTGFLGGFDFSFNYLYQYDDRPVFQGLLTTIDGVPTSSFTLTYERTHLIAGTLSNAFGNLTVRGEVVYRTDRFLSTTDVRQPDLLHDTPELGYVLGLDWYGLSDTLVSFQLFQSWLLDDAPGLLRDRLDTNLTLYAEHRLWNDRLKLEALWIHSTNAQDGLVRPKVTYELRSGLDVWVGFDVFYGDSEGVFGQFGSRDRGVIGVQLAL